MRFPKEIFVKKKWLTACKVDVVPNNTGVCAAHFAPESYHVIGSKQSARLKKYAVPDPNLSSTSGAPTHAPVSEEEVTSMQDVRGTLPPMDDTEKLWVMVTNHTADIHVTPSGMNRCHHGELTEEERDAPWLEPGSAPHRALQEVVHHRQVLDLADYVCTFRHTGMIEVFHAAALKYTPKLVYFAPPTYTMRKQLAVIDCTANKDRSVALDKDGNEKMVRVYSRVSDCYHLRPVKVPKEDSHVRPLLEAAVRLRYETTIMGSAHHEGDPRSIFPYVHRGPRADETMEALRVSRASCSRFSDAFGDGCRRQKPTAQEDEDPLTPNQSEAEEPVDAGAHPAPSVPIKPHDRSRSGRRRVAPRRYSPPGI